MKLKYLPLTLTLLATNLDAQPKSYDALKNYWNRIFGKEDKALILNKDSTQQYLEQLRKDSSAKAQDCCAKKEADKKIKPRILIPKKQDSQLIFLHPLKI